MNFIIQVDYIKIKVSKLPVYQHTHVSAHTVL